MIVSNPILINAQQTPALNIETNDNKVLFNLNNLKPGDTAIRKLTVQNRGELDFTYISDAKLQDGSEKLFNELLLEVSDSKGTLFSGKMKDFVGFSPRLLKSLHEEELLFAVEFPSHLGNDFQGLYSEVLFRFYIEKLIEDPENPNGTDPDSPTETPTEPNPGQENPGDSTNPNPDAEETGDSGSPGNSESPGNIENPENTDETGTDENEDSVNPSLPSNSNPEDPSNPGTTDDSKDSDASDVAPQRPIDTNTLNTAPVEGQVLPDTATNIFNYILAGVILLSLGIVTLLILKKRRLALKF